MKSLLHNPFVSSLLIFGGLALTMWPKMLRSIGIIHYDQSWRPIFLIGGFIMSISGLAIYFYQERNSKENVLKDYLLKLALGIIIFVFMMVTGIISTPSIFR